MTKESEWGERMTVGELIEKLQKFPPNLPVVFHDGEYGEYWDTASIVRVRWYDDWETVYIHPFSADYREDLQERVNLGSPGSESTLQG